MRINAALDRLIRRPVALLPAWAVVPVAVLCIVGGMVLALRPFTSVEGLVVLAGVNAILTGVLIFASHGEATSEREALLSVGWIVLGMVTLAWPSLSVAALAVVIGAALVVNGLSDVVRTLAGRQPSERAAELVGGLASIVFGVLASSWPDITVFLVAVLFGARMVLFGVSQLIAVLKRWRRRTAEAAPARAQRGWFRRGLRLAGRLVALAAALLFLAISLAFHSKAPAAPPAFYNTPSTVPSTPGELLRSESYTTKAVPHDAQAWRILYSTKSSLGAPAVGSAIVLAPKDLPSGPRPVVLWDHGTLGEARPCAPSLAADPWLGIPAVPEVLAHGWVMVQPDYVGMGTEGVAPYLIGRGEASSALDAARAGHQLPGLSLSKQTVVWGHSQGGNAALWTGKLADSYAPQLTIDGGAALSAASDLVPLAQYVKGDAGGTVVLAYLTTAYANTYPNVHLDDLLRPGARVELAEAAKRCLSDPGLALSVITIGAQPGSIFRTDFASGPLSQRLRENTPDANIAAPLLVAQGTTDEVIPITITKRWVSQQCAAGHKLEFRTTRARPT